MDSSGRLFKGLFGALALVGFIWLLLVGILESGGTRTTTTTLNPRPAGAAMMNMEMIGREKIVHSELDLNYMSKRRVPNGPDPIHNRRAGNSGRPPGQA